MVGSSRELAGPDGEERGRWLGWLMLSVKYVSGSYLMHSIESSVQMPRKNVRGHEEDPLKE